MSLVRGDAHGRRGLAGRKLSFSDWFLKVFVVRSDRPVAGPGEDVKVVELFLGVGPVRQKTFLRGTERIEFRLCSKVVEEAFRKEIEKRRKVGLSAFKKRIASRIVSVEEDGTERRLVEGL